MKYLQPSHGLPTDEMEQSGTYLNENVFCILPLQPEAGQGIPHFSGRDVSDALGLEQLRHLGEQKRNNQELPKISTKKGGGGGKSEKNESSYQHK